MKYGKVYLVGAGPGDPELLTLKAVKAMRAAHVMLVDDLVSDEVLAFANPETRIVYVGKRGGCKSTPQEFIERLMIAEARQGRIVVRLKGGDPFVFGRGGEECESLRAADIECEIVNGITAGLAAPTALGIPLTHREHCHGAVFVTGHAGDDAATVPNWQALVATGLPLVIYMGVSRCQSIQQDLLIGDARVDADRGHSKRHATRPACHRDDVAETRRRYPRVRHRQPGHHGRGRNGAVCECGCV